MSTGPEIERRAYYAVLLPSELQWTTPRQMPSFLHPLYKPDTQFTISRLIRCYVCILWRTQNILILYSVSIRS